MRLLRSILVVAVFAIASVAAAGVGPIEEDPVPTWASKSDVCNAIRSCDSCAVKVNQSYCFYTEQGQATCCNKALGREQNAPLVASVGPIEEDPVPAWATDKDACGDVKSCDNCAPNNAQYCKYTDAGAARCCKRSSTPLGKMASAQTPLLSASVGPITEDPVPAWASASDVCNRKRSCDYCSGDKTYCKYTESGVAQCCTAAVEESKPLVASVGPIEEDPVPQWASKSDVCNAVNTCDKCAVKKDKSYCFYTEQGQATCCNKAASAQPSAPLVASVGPIEEDPVPQWASKSDSCSAIKSCDSCSVKKNKSYCFYTEQGQATCCNRNAAAAASPALSASVGPIEENPVPVWATAADMCLEMKSCDSCAVKANKSYCKYSDAGAAQCCSRSL